MMVTYDFYVHTYMGQQIPENHFSRCMNQATAMLERLDSICDVRGGEDSRSMALCAMAEAVYAHESRGGVVASSVGQVSVRYNQKENLNRELYHRACIYLDIYRGKS